jgi:hypothetical protein
MPLPKLEEKSDEVEIILNGNTLGFNLISNRSETASIKLNIHPTFIDFKRDSLVAEELTKNNQHFIITLDQFISSLTDTAQVEFYKANPLLNNNNPCDPYCICPKCGAGPESIEPQFRHLYRTSQSDKDDNKLD